MQIAAALVHWPTALVLDEPFSGLDPLAVDSMVDLLRDEASDLPLLFSSHQLELVERLCDDLVILADGRVVASGPVDELSRRGPTAIASSSTVRTQHGSATFAVSSVVDVDGSVALLDLDGLKAADLARIVVERSSVVELSRARQPLSQIFREAVR